MWSAFWPLDSAAPAPDYPCVVVPHPHTTHHMYRALRVSLVVPALFVVAASTAFAQRGGRGGGGGGNQPDPFPTVIPPDDARVTALKAEAVRLVDSRSEEHTSELQSPYVIS